MAPFFSTQYSPCFQPSSLHFCPCCTPCVLRVFGGQWPRAWTQISRHMTFFSFSSTHRVTLVFLVLNGWHQQSSLTKLAAWEEKGGKEGGRRLPRARSSSQRNKTRQDKSSPSSCFSFFPPNLCDLCGNVIAFWKSSLLPLIVLELRARLCTYLSRLERPREA